VDSGSYSRFLVLLTKAITETPQQQSVVCDDNAFNLVLNKVSNMLFIIGLCCLLNSTLDDWRTKCPVMKFGTSVLYGPQSKPFKSLSATDIKRQFGNIVRDFSFKDEMLYTLNPGQVEACDIWGLIKSAEHTPNDHNPGYTVKGIDLNVFHSPALYGLNQRLARKVNNVATTTTLAYDIIDAGFVSLHDKYTTGSTSDIFKLAEEMIPALQHRKNRWTFRTDAYYDSVLYHQFMAMGMHVYHSTCRNNGLPLHVSANNAQSMQVMFPPTQISAANDNALSKNAPAADTLLYSFYLSYDPFQRNDLDSSSLRNLLKQIIPSPGSLIKSTLKYLAEMDVVKPVDGKRKRMWEILPYLPNNQRLRRLLKSVYIDADYSLHAARYKNLRHHKPTLRMYFSSVAHKGHLRGILYRYFRRYIENAHNVNYSWVIAREQNRIWIGAWCALFERLDLLDEESKRSLYLSSKQMSWMYNESAASGPYQWNIQPCYTAPCYTAPCNPLKRKLPAITANKRKKRRLLPKNQSLGFPEYSESSSGDLIVESSLCPTESISDDDEDIDMNGADE